MGASESSETSKSEHKDRLTAHEAELRRERERLEAEKKQWHEQQIREHWKQQQLLEDQKLKETQLEWQRQADLRQLRLQQQKLQKELEEQKVQRKLEQERLERKLQEQEQARVEANEQRLLLQKIKLHQQSFAGLSTTAQPCSVDLPKMAVAFQQRASPAVETKTKPKPEGKPKSYLDRMNELNIKCAEWSIIDYVTSENGISEAVAEQIMKLLDDDNTIPFIARYRRHLTEGMDPEKLRKVRESYEQAKLIKCRAVSIIKDIEKKGQWTPEFHAFVHETKSLIKLERIYSVFNAAETKVVKRATMAGLEIVAEGILKDKTFIPPSQLVQESLDGLKTEDQVKESLIALMASMIFKDRRTFDTIDKLISQHSIEIETARLQNGKTVNKPIENEDKYELYYRFQGTVKSLHFSQIFAINRGQELKILTVKIIIPDTFVRNIKDRCLRQYKFTGMSSMLKKDLILLAIDFAYDRSIKGSVAKRIRQDMNERAVNEAMMNLLQNVKQNLLVPPVRGKAIIGISPGFENGCKLAAISAQGDVLDTKTIYPNFASNPRCKQEAERILVGMVCTHRCKIFALGNGTACEETERFLIHALKNKKIASLDVSYTIVDQTGALKYSQSREAALEFPHVQADFVSAVSIARRLQDPMEELVKIEPELLTQEMYQPDVPKKELAKKINEVIVSVVSYVGVDANTASLALLKRVAGLDDARANGIVEWRRNHGPFIDRNDLLKVKGISKRVFQQCAGFIRIMPGIAPTIGRQPINLFDQTWIHPESYSVAQSVLDSAGCTLLARGTNDFKCALDLFVRRGSTVLAKKLNTNVETIEMIVESLKMDPELDIRGNVDESIFRKSLIRFNDLSIGTVLTGVVTHLAKFGAFVDVSAEIDGLIHNGSMNGMTVTVEQKVEVRVSSISKERGRLGLTLIRCV